MQAYMLYIRQDCEICFEKLYYSLTEMLVAAKRWANSGVDCWMRKVGEDNYFIRYYKYNSIIVEVL